MVVKSSYKHACFYGILSFFCLTVIPVGSGKLSQWWVVLVVLVIVVFLSVIGNRACISISGGDRNGSNGSGVLICGSLID